MKVLQVQGLVAGGGAEVHTYILSKGLIERGHEVVLAAPEPRDPLIDDFRRAGCKIEILRERPTWMRLFDVPSALRLARVIREHDIDVVHTHIWNADAVGWLAARLTGRPVVSTLHGPTVPVHIERHWHHRLYLRLYTLILRNIDDRIAISNFVKRYTHDDLGIPLDDMTVVHNCSDVGAYQDVQADGVREAIGVPVDAPMAIIVGELTGRKGILEFIEMAGLAAQAVPDAHFVLAGRGPLEAPARARAQELGIEDRTHFLGWRKDVPELLAASDLLVVTSFEEGFGRTITEAMASSLPVVSFDSGAPGEIIVDQETGYLIPPFDVERFAARTSEVLQDPALCNRMGEAGRRRALQEFDTSVFVDRTERVLARALAVRGRQADAS